MKKIDKKRITEIEDIVASNQFPLKSAMLEKDILVSEAVTVVAKVGQNHGAQIIFASGTSLSQAYGIVQRMSEDADFCIVLPFDIKSGNQRRKLLSVLKDDLVQRLGDAGFPIDGELQARN